MSSAFARSPRVAARLLDRFEVRLGLSVAIILSLLPWEDGAERHSEAVTWGFFGLFAVELTLRALAWFHVPEGAEDERQAPGRRRLGHLLLLAVDLVALASFVPWSVDGAHVRWLRIFRLTRLVLVAAYWAPLVRDLWSVLSRRERARQVVLMGMMVAAMSFAGTIVLAHLGGGGIDFDDDGVVGVADEQFLTRLWWAFRQIQDPGNMLAAPEHAVGVLVSLVLTLFGLLLVSFLIGLGADVVRELVDLNRNRAPGLVGHTVLVNVTPALPRLLHELMRYYRKLFAVPRYALLGHAEERPAFLHAPELARVVYRFGQPGEPDLLTRVDAARARRIVILSDSASPDPDAETAGTMLMAREANAQAWLVAEILHTANIGVARVAGGARTVIVPTEKLLGLVLGAMVRRPGIEDLLRVLLTSHGHEIYTWFMDEPGLDCPGRRLAITGPVRFDALFEAGLAAPGADRVVPLGLIVPAGPPEAPAGFELLLGGPPGGATRVPRGEIRGVIALAQHFGAVRHFGERLLANGLPAPRSDAEAPPPSPPLAPVAPRRPRRVLVCGFRPAVVHLCEALMLADPEVEIVLLADADGLAEAARAAFAARSVHVRSGLANEHGPIGTFEPLADGRLTYAPRGSEDRRGRLAVAAADWTSDAVLLALPGAEAPRHVGEMDAVVFAGADERASDGRTALAVLKVADQLARSPGRFSPDFRVVAEVVDEALGRRLEQRFARAIAGTPLGSARRLQIASSQTLRACFTLQSVTVPGFDAIFSELLTPRGPTFAALRLDGRPPDAPWSFVRLARSLRTRGLTLLGLELRTAEGPQMVLCPREGALGDAFRVQDILTVWVIESGAESPEVRVAEAETPVRGKARRSRGRARGEVTAA